MRSPFGKKDLLPLCNINIGQNPSLPMWHQTHLITNLWVTKTEKEPQRRKLFIQKWTLMDACVSQHLFMKQREQLDITMDYQWVLLLLSANSECGLYCPLLKLNVIDDSSIHKWQLEKSKCKHTDETTFLMTVTVFITVSLYNIEFFYCDWNSNSNLRARQAEEQRIKVCVRKRPLTCTESRQREADVVTTPGGECVIVHEVKEAVDLSQYILQVNVQRGDSVL